MPVSNAATAAELIPKIYSKISAFILDIEMKGQELTGIQIAEQIRKNPQCATVPIIFLTSYVHFGSGALHDIHYYDFLSKVDSKKLLINTLEKALGIHLVTNNLSTPHIIVECTSCSLEISIESISCIDLFGSKLLITDFSGETQAYRVKPHAFSDICVQLENISGHSLKQIHRCVIVNVNRIKEIQWHKNSAQIWLFNVSDWKPAGKTYLHKLSQFK